MNGMLGLSMQPLAAAVRLGGGSVVVKERRHFLTLSGTTDYINFDESVPVGETLEFSFATFSQNAQGFMWNSNGSYIRILNGGLRTFNSANSVTHDFGAGLADGKIHTISLVFNGTSTLSYVDGVNVGSVAGRAIPESFDRVGYYQSGYMSGRLFNLTNKTSAGETINLWPLSDASDVVYDVVGGEHGSLINSTESDWAFFERNPFWDYWVGVENLFVPTSISGSWSVNGDGSFTKNSNAYGQIGESTSSSTIVTTGHYLVKCHLDGDSIRLFTRASDDTQNLSYNLSGGDNEIQIFVPLRGLVFDDHTSQGETISNISVKRLLMEAA